jgi:pantetheine-phosphate adenylyltransferase
MTRAVYPGTFDPITMGHFDLIHRASHLFTQVIVAVAQADHKNTLLSFEERFDLVKQSLAHLPAVTVLPLQGLLVDFALQHEVNVVLRGLRTAADFEYEFQLAGMNRKLSPHLETMFMTPSEETLFISSTLVRELIRFEGEVGAFVPPQVAQFLQKKQGSYGPQN